MRIRRKHRHWRVLRPMPLPARGLQQDIIERVVSRRNNTDKRRLHPPHGISAAQGGPLTATKTYAPEAYCQQSNTAEAGEQPCAPWGRGAFLVDHRQQSQRNAAERTETQRHADTSRDAPWSREKRPESTLSETRHGAGRSAWGRPCQKRATGPRGAHRVDPVRNAPWGREERTETQRPQTQHRPTTATPQITGRPSTTASPLVAATAAFIR